jgi:hypothetical protein
MHETPRQSEAVVHAEELNEYAGFIIGHRRLDLTDEPLVLTNAIL